MLLILADHGFKCAEDRPEQGGDSVFGAQAELWHTGIATWYAWSPAPALVAKHWKPLTDATVQDAADTVLALGGFPHGARSWWTETDADPRAWARYRARWQRMERSAADSSDPAALEALKTLGYVDAGGTAPETASATDTALVNEGIVALEKGDVTGAEAKFRAALAVNPQSSAAYHNLCVLALRQGDFPLATEQFLQGRRRDTADNPQAWTDFILLLAGEKRPAEIHRVANAGMAKFSEAYEIPQAAGTPLGELGHCKEAQPLFITALALRPQAVPTLNNAGVCAQQLGRPAEAIAYFERSLSADPNQPQVRAVLNDLKAKP